MDAMHIKRLEEASQSGDMNSLHQLLQEDKFILDRAIAVSSIGYNPLHISALLGHVGFAQEIITRKPELAKELNSDGLIPLHLAAASGHLPVVKELLKAGSEICLLRDAKEGLMPVHMTAIKGRVVVVTELTKDCEAATHEHSHKGETILHLAVRANSLETVKFLMSRMVNDIIINAKDERGNTALHLAVASKNLRMIKLLLSNKEIMINSTNTRGFTPFDVLLESRQEYGDLIIGETIRAAGGKTMTELAPSQQFVIPDSILENKLVKIESEKSNRIQDHSDTTTIKGVEKSILELKKLANGKSQNPDIVLLTATLVATITFQAGLTPPGGFESTTDVKKIWKGEAVLDDNLDIFLVLDMIGLYSAVSVILIFLSVSPQRSKTLMKLLVCVTWISVFATTLAFTMGVYEIFNKDSVTLSFLRVWFLVLRLGIFWVSIRFIIFLVKKGELEEPVKTCFGFVKKITGQLMWRRIAMIRKKLRNSTFIRKIIFIGFIMCVLIANSVVYWLIYRVVGL